MIRFAYVVTGDSMEAEDLVQEAFIRLYRARGRVEYEGASAYARRTILNLKRSAYRRVVREWKAFRRIGRVASGGDPAATVGDQDVRRAFLSLPVRQRACIALRFYEDMKEQDIAEVLDMSVSAVKKNVQRGLDRMRLLLKEPP